MVLTLYRLLGSVSRRFRPQSACEACGQPFTCGATLGGCWCAEVQVSDEVRADLRTRYKKCLCRACLERAATSASVGRPPGSEDPASIGSA